MTDIPVEDEVWTVHEQVVAGAPPRSYPLAVYAGDYWSRTFTFTATGTGTALDMSGTHVAQIRRTAQGELVAAFTVDTTDAAGGVVTLTLPPAVSQAVAAADPSPARELAYVWDWQITRPSGETATVLRGPLTLVRDVTRP